MALKLPNMHAVQKGNMSLEAFNDKWETLSTAFDQIHACKQAKCSFQLLYQAVFQIVQQDHCDKLYAKLMDKIEAQVQGHLGLILKSLRADRAVLAVVSEQWNRHMTTTRRITDLMAHLERQYCAKARKPIVRIASMRQFGRTVLHNKQICDAVRHAFLDAIRRDRDGEEASSELLLRTVSGMFQNIDDVEEAAATSLYHDVLLKPFLDRTTAYYEAEAATLIATASVSQFVERYFRRLADEVRRTTAMLDHSAAISVDKIVSKAFIGNHGERLIDNEVTGLMAMLRAWRVDDVRSLYRAFEHRGAEDEVVRAACNFVVEEGTAVVTNEENIANAIAFVEKLIELRQRVTTLINDAFATDAGHINRFAEASLTTAFERVVNRQPFTAEYLSRLLDSKLRSQPTDADVERVSEDVMAIFTRLIHKDEFETAYRGHLARRLLAGRTTAAEDQERIFIARLKRECGVAVASALEGMFADRATSDELMERFRERLAERGEQLSVGIHCFVLTAGFWPSPVSLNLTLPPDLERTAKVFKMFYLGRHAGRRFSYSFANGTVDLRMAHCGRRYDVNVPTYCAPVLVRFQADESATIEDVSNATGMTVAETAKAVASLTRAMPTFTGLLAISNSSGTSKGGITASTRVQFNDKFKSKSTKVRVVPAVAKERSEGGLSTAKAREQLEEDRKYRVDAAVVRIMKSRKTLDHQTLVAETIGVLQSKFAPAPELIKKRIEHLIEREFLERTEQRNVYNYLA